MARIRKLTPETTFDEAEDEIYFTRATLQADPESADLLPLTDD